MMSPLRFSIIAGRNARHIKKMLRTLAAKTSSQSSSEMSVRGATGPAIPALFTRIETSSDPSLRTNATTESSDDTSTVATTALEPSSWRTASSLSRDRPARTTRAPSAANRTAIARPRPLPAPVTSAVRPSMLSAVSTVIACSAAPTAGRRPRTCRPGRRPTERVPRTAQPEQPVRTALRARRSQPCRRPPGR